MTQSLFEQCAAEQGTNETSNILQCVANAVEAVAEKDLNTDLTSWFLIMAGALVFFMQAGFAMVCAGAVRSKNVQNTLLKNLLDACGAGIAFYAVGYAFSFGETDSTGITFIGTSNFFMRGNVDPALWFFQYAFSATAVTIVAGTLAERCQMAAYMCYSLFLTGFVYPVVVHAIWSSNGFLSTTQADAVIGYGMVDFAGSAVVHMTGGSTALIATVLLGPRRGRFTDKNGNPLRKPGLTKGHSVGLQMLGTFVLWFGWYGFNPGSALLAGVEGTGEIAATAAVTTTLAAAVGAVSALLTNAFIQARQSGEYEFDVVMAMNGCLSGLVAITAGCAVVEAWAAIIIGLIAGWIYVGTSALLLKLHIDDAVDAIPVHLTNGLWGVVSVGLLASPELLNAAYGTDEHVGFFYSFGNGGVDATLLAAEVVGALFVIAWTSLTMFPFFLTLNYLGWFRVDALEELVGLDATYKEDGLDDDESDTNEDERIAAYNERLRQKQEIREARAAKKSVEDVVNSAWGTAELSVHRAEIPLDSSDAVGKKSADQEQPEQAPPPGKKKKEPAGSDWHDWYQKRMERIHRQVEESSHNEDDGKRFM